MPRTDRLEEVRVDEPFLGLNVFTEQMFIFGRYQFHYEIFDICVEVFFFFFASKLKNVFEACVRKPD